MSRLILAIAIFIPLATVLFVTMNSNGKKGSSKPDTQVVDLEDDAPETEKHFTVEITGDNFEQMVRKSEQPVVLDFWAPWCGPCMMLGPHMDEIAEDYEELAIVGKIDIDVQKELAELYEVESIPLILVLKDGEVVEKFIGFDQETPGKIREMLDGMINP